MQPYINPNFYQQPMFQQQIQPIVQNQSTRFVNDFSEIQVNEIPMDGTYKLFAKNDMSEVQAKAWGSNGLINTLEYSLKQTPKISNTDNVSTNDFKTEIEPILTEIKALNEKIDKLVKTGGKKNESNANV